ncbi:hypothetical protein GDAKBCAL_01881 [Streptococcus equi subsp. zooepidemicus]|nr:hypothetical protein Q426_09675 [Streptococcus equi subsp. zooepidemicus CY]QTZ30357.1 hypothetical protein GDAKBCAL_01881 [Streptococcus equi subsp. zooepidemicus]QTZ57882.1 hypothetical protein JFMEOBDD_01975 [Streptococcus equi subsp. zooepidemicus]SQF54884.1 Uncharacterised protein [Streptococcus equi subsp. zooepidemicus]SQF82540.1 Uncharacterised protein [Streptococcus equi subsp. zooepidemicus]
MEDKVGLTFGVFHKHKMSQANRQDSLFSLTQRLCLKH